MKLRILTWLGLALFLAGIFLPWIRSVVLGQRSQVLGVQCPDGRLAIGVAAAAVLAEVAATLWRRRLWLIAGFTASIVGAMLLGINVVDILQSDRKQGRSSDFTKSGAAVAKHSAGAGIYICLGGSLLATAGFFMRWKIAGKSNRFEIATEMGATETDAPA